MDLQDKTPDKLWRLENEITAELSNLEDRRNELRSLRLKVMDEINDRNETELEALRQQRLKVQKEEPGHYFECNIGAMKNVVGYGK